MTTMSASSASASVRGRFGPGLGLGDRFLGRGDPRLLERDVGVEGLDRADQLVVLGGQRVELGRDVGGLATGVLALPGAGRRRRPSCAPAESDGEGPASEADARPPRSTCGGGGECDGPHRGEIVTGTQ